MIPKGALNLAAAPIPLVAPLVPEPAMVVTVLVVKSIFLILFPVQSAMYRFFPSLVIPAGSLNLAVAVPIPSVDMQDDAAPPMVVTVAVAKSIFLIRQ